MTTSMSVARQCPVKAHQTYTATALSVHLLIWH